MKMNLKLKSTLVHPLTFLSAAIINFVLLTPSAQAQFLWSDRVASTVDTDNELSIGMTLDTNDNCYVTGWFDGTNNFGGVTLTNLNIGGQDIFVAKYNATGALQWVQQAGGISGNRDEARGIGVDANGYVYVTGGYYSPASFGNSNLPSSWSEEFFLAKYDNSGVLQWVQTSSGGWGAYGTGLAVDSSGNSYAVGYDSDGQTIAFGSVNLTNPPTSGYSTFLVKYDNTGSAKWAQSLGGSGQVYATKVAVDAVGNVYVRGTFTATLTIGTSNLVAAPGGDKNMFVAKFNNTGTLIWVQQGTGANVDEGGVAVDPAGNVFVTGSFDNTLDLGNGVALTNHALFGDAFVAKYNSSGAIQWAQSAGGANGGFYWDVSLDAQTNVYPAGILGYNAAVSKYSPDGTLQWTRSASGPTASPFASAVAKIAADTNGNCYLAGWYRTNTDFSATTLEPQGYWNFFLTEVVTNPTVQFTASPTSGAPSLTVQFNATNVDSSSNTITSWNWNFGDGGTSTLQNPVHVYTNIGTFYPTLVATNNKSATVLGSGPQITLTNPIVHFTVNPSVGEPPLTVQFNCTNVDSLGNIITSWNWNFGDGQTSSLQNPSHTYSIAGNFAPTLVATNYSNVAVIGYGPQLLTGTAAANFTYTTNNGAIIITGYNGPSGIVVIPYTINNLPVTGISDYAFEGDGLITNICIPNSVTNLGTESFWSCYNLTNISLGTGITSIGNSEFAGCALSTITIPNSVTSIGDYAFSQCSALTSVTIPSNVTNIGVFAFAGCTNLTAINVNADNPAYSSLDGVLFSENQATLIQYPENNGALTYTIPGTVTTVGDSAFQSCMNITNVIIPGAVTNIGNSAFGGPSSLATISVVATNANFSSLNGILFDKSQTTLIQYPLNNAAASYTIPNSVMSIDSYAFSGCQNLTSIVIPSNLTNSQDAFYGSSVANVTFANGANSIGELEFGGCTALTNISIPNSITSIGEFAFQGCFTLTSITIPNSLTNCFDGFFYSSVANVAFAPGTTAILSGEFDGSPLSNVVIPKGVTSIGDGAFSDCGYLLSVCIPNGVTNIGVYAFLRCFDLSSISIPNSVASIEYGAFDECTSLTNITIPASVTNLGGYAFANCSSLIEAYFQGNAPSVDGEVGSVDTTVFSGESGTVYYIPGTSGWGTFFGGWPTAKWYQPNPTILGTGCGLGASSNGFGFTISWATNISVVVQACTNLANPAWTPVSTNALTNGTFYFSDPHWTNYPGRFYRILSP